MTFKFNHEVLRFVTRSAKSKAGSVQIEFKVASEDLETEPKTAYFDQIILALDADSCLKLLGKEATFLEKRFSSDTSFTKS